MHFGVYKRANWNMHALNLQNSGLSILLYNSISASAAVHGVERLHETLNWLHPLCVVHELKQYLLQYNVYRSNLSSDANHTFYKYTQWKTKHIPWNLADRILRGLCPVMFITEENIFLYLSAQNRTWPKDLSENVVRYSWGQLRVLYCQS